MSSPRPILDLMDLQEDIIHGRSTLRPGPVRVEAPLEAILTDEVAAPLDSLLDRASYVAPTVTGSISESQWASLASTAVRLDLHVELRIGAPPPMQWIATELAERLARVVIACSASEAAQNAEAIRALAAHVFGRTTALLPAWDGPVSDLSSLIRSLGGTDPGVEVEVIPGNGDARDRLKEAWSALSADASTAGIALIVRGGETVRGGPAADPIFGPNVLDQCIRSLFRTRPSLCPFPFLNAYVSSEARPICPNPDGPRLPGDEPDPWNSAVHVATRQGFYDGEPPEPCRRCTDLPRILRDLAHVTWSGGLTDGSRPPGSMEV